MTPTVFNQYISPSRSQFKVQHINARRPLGGGPGVALGGRAAGGVGGRLLEGGGGAWQRRRPRHAVGNGAPGREAARRRPRRRRAAPSLLRRRRRRRLRGGTRGRGGGRRRPRGALLWAQLGVLRLLVAAQVDLALERASAQVARERLEAGVLAAVRDQVGRLAERLAAHAALVRLFTWNRAEEAF